MRAGEEQAFEEFFAIYFQPLFRFALSRVGRQRDLAKEVAQVAICTALEKLHLFRGEAQLFTWLCAICRCEIFAARRRERREALSEPLTEDLLTRPEDRTAAQLEDPEHRLLRDEVARQVRQTVDCLPPHYAQALAWKYTDGLPVNEIARRLGVSAKAAESLLTRAREAFRAHFPAPIDTRRQVARSVLSS